MELARVIISDGRHYINIKHPEYGFKVSRSELEARMPGANLKMLAIALRLMGYEVVRRDTVLIIKHNPREALRQLLKRNHDGYILSARYAKLFEAYTGLSAISLLERLGYRVYINARDRHE